MTTQQKTNTTTRRSDEEPALKWTAPRAPKFHSYNQRDTDLDDLISLADCHISSSASQPEERISPPPELQARLQRSSRSNVAHVTDYHLDQLTHEVGVCNQMSLCPKCVTLRKVTKLMRKIPTRTENILERYYVCIGRLNMHEFRVRTSQDQQTFASQDITMRAQLTRSLGYYKHHVTRDMSAILREYMVPQREGKLNAIARSKARDLKYVLENTFEAERLCVFRRLSQSDESEFEAQGLGPIEHARGDCAEQFSMCDDCISLHKCFTYGKRIPERKNAGYALFWRVFARLTSEQANMVVQCSKYWVTGFATANEVDEFFFYFHIHAPVLGPNTSEMLALFQMYESRRNYLKLSMSARESEFQAQTWTLGKIEFSIPSIDKITDTINNLIVTNNIGVDASTWARRLTSFVIMLMQLCAESTLFIKVTAIAQFMTHFHFPGIETLRGYAQQLAQVFQTAMDKIKGRPPMYRDLATGLEDSDDENDFRAQADTENIPEGLLIGTAKLLCGMAGITDYDIKMNAKRVSKLDQISRTITSMERLAHFTERLFKYAYEMCSVHVFGIHPDMRELQMVSEKIPLWMDTVTNYYAAEGIVRVTKNLDEARRVQQWQKEGDEYNALLWKFKTLPKAYAIFKTVYNQCDKMNQAAAPYLMDSAMRVSPFTILIFGSPGVGKSVTTYSIITDLMTPSFKRRGLVFKPGEQVHVRNSEAKHWDGYNGQAVVIVDDVYQSMDPESTIQQSMDICHMKNIVSWPVTKADLGSKGNTFMTSELLVMTGNVAIPNDITKCVRSFDAIRRRIDLMVQQKVLPAYLDKSGRLDKSKVEDEFPTQFIDGEPVAADVTSIFRFDVFDNQNQPLMRDGTYAGLVKIALRMKDIEKNRDQALIRANYLRAGLDINGQVRTEQKFEAQMWSSARNAITRSPSPPQENEYAGDLLFDEDVAHVQALCNNTPWSERSCGFLTEEERIEIFAVVHHEVEPDPTWSTRMRAVYDKVKSTVRLTSNIFTTAVGNFVDKTRESMNGHLMYRVGKMVLLAVGLVTAGFAINAALREKKNPDLDEQLHQDNYISETSGDEKTRQTRTKLKVESDTATKTMYGKTYVAVQNSDPRLKQTTWIPENAVNLKKHKVLKVNDVLWQDKGDELPRDLIGKGPDGGFVAQACPDRNAYNLGVNRITNNAVLIRAIHEDRVVSELRGLFVYGRVLMAPLHFFHGLDLKDTKIELVTAHGLKMEFNTNECDIKTPTQDMDITFLRLPKRFQCYIDLRSHFHTSDTINKYALREAMLWVIDGENNSKMVTLCDNITKDTVLDYRVTPFASQDPDVNIHLVKSYVYRGVTLAGYCGAPLVWLNSSVQGGHILGIHVAGSNLRGLSSPITREFLYEFLRDWDDISIRVPELDTDDGIMTAHSKRAISRNSGLAHYGRVDPKMQVRMPSTTNIVRSPLYGVFPPTTAPAMLTPTKEINPLRTGILKQRVPLTVFPQKSVDDATRHLKNALLGCDSPYVKRKNDRMVLTVHEALNGIPGDKWIPPMNLHTSPGYPYINSNTSRNGKFDFVTGEPGERALCDVVNQKLKERLTNAKARTVDMTLFMDILKDERVKLERAVQGRTRIFNVAPFDLNVATRQYFQMFAAHVMHNHVYGECAVGLNPHSDEWGMMYHHMKHAGKNWIGGDYSNYDKQLSYQVLKAVLTIIDSFYDDENNDIRECLFETMFSAFHIAERDIYRVPQGNPSGIVMTSLVNSLANSIMMRIMYVELGGNLTTFDDNVRLTTYGDDNIAAVSDMIPWFNMSSISKKFAEYGIVYNQPNKEAMTEIPYLQEQDLTFLKRGFRIDSGRVLAPLNMDSIREMVNWIRESNDDDEATRANFLAACREMYHYGREDFTRFTSDVYVYAQKLSFKLPYTDYQTSGDFWGAENDDRVNLTATETTYGVEHCCDLGNEEALFRAQSKRAPRKTMAMWPLLCDLLIISVVYNSTSNTTPNDNTSSSNTNSDNVTSRQEITTFSDSSVLTETNPQHIPSIPMTPIDPYMKETLTSFLSRVYYKSFSWTAAQPMGTLLASIQFPTFLFGVTPIWDKLKNFAYFRAGVKIGIRMNGSKFHYGQILVSWTPQFGNTMDLQGASNNLYTASGCPCFTVSPSENEVHEFILPYALPYQYIPLFRMTGTGDPAFHFGVVNIYVLNPLSNAATPTPVTYTVFANFVDVDIAGYAPVAYSLPFRTIDDQSTMPALIFDTPSVPSSAVMPDPLPGYTGDSTDPWVAQRATKEQKEKSEKGIVGTIAESVAGIAGALIPIPEIGEVAAGVSVVARGVATIANIFGWTNPPSLRAHQPIIGKFHNFANTHGLSDAVNLGLHPDAAVAPATQHLGGDGKEMTMLHIAQTPSLLAAGISWASTDLGSATIYETIVSPVAENTDVTNAAINPTLMSYVSKAAKFWRGSIKYHIQITCSQMHVGRLRVYFVPYTNATGLTNDQLSSCASTIIDIEQQTTMSFTIPYLFSNPWCEVYAAGWIAKRVGLMRIAVLNELNHPVVPVPPVYINVWAMAGPDFQLARPSSERLPLNLWTPLPSLEEEEFVAQGLTRDAIRDMPAPSLIPASGAVEHNICNADEIVHIKELIMRPQWLGTLTAAAQPLWQQFFVTPFNPVKRLPGNNVANNGYYDYFRMIYRYTRGSVKLAFLQTIQGNSIATWTDTQNIISNVTNLTDGNTLGAYLPYVQNVGAVATSAIISNSTGNGASYCQQKGMPQVATIPYYSTMYGITNAAWYGAASPSLSWNVYGTTPAAQVVCRIGGDLLLMAGDDMELVFLVGAPALSTGTR